MNFTRDFLFQNYKWSLFGYYAVIQTRAMRKGSSHLIYIIYIIVKQE